MCAKVRSIRPVSGSFISARPASLKNDSDKRGEYIASERLRLAEGVYVATQNLTIKYYVPPLASRPSKRVSWFDRPSTLTEQVVSVFFSSIASKHSRNNILGGGRDPPKKTFSCC